MNKIYIGTIFIMEEEYSTEEIIGEKLYGEVLDSTVFLLDDLIHDNIYRDSWDNLNEEMAG